jgi:hypothetical protein
MPTRAQVGVHVQNLIIVMFLQYSPGTAPIMTVAPRQKAFAPPAEMLRAAAAVCTCLPSTCRRTNRLSKGCVISMPAAPEHQPAAKSTAHSLSCITAALSLAESCHSLGAKTGPVAVARDLLRAQIRAYIVFDSCGPLLAALIRIAFICSYDFQFESTSKGCKIEEEP